MFTSQKLRLTERIPTLQELSSYKKKLWFYVEFLQCLTKYLYVYLLMYIFTKRILKIPKRFDFDEHRENP